MPSSTDSLAHEGVQFDALMRQMPLDLGPAAVPGLDDFIEGGNAQALNWLRG